MRVDKPTFTNAFDDDTAGNVSTSAHGLAPKAPNDATNFLDGTGAYDTVKDSDLSTSDVTTNDVTISKHGFTPKAPNDTSKFLRGDATWASPSASADIRSVFLRHTVLTAQVSATTGRPNYLSAGTGLAMTLAASSTDPWIGTWANGFDLEAGASDYVKKLTSNQTISSLTNFATPRLYVENDGSGNLTYAHSVYKPYHGIVFNGYKALAKHASFEGTNGATSYTDQMNDTWTLVNGATIATNANKKFNANTSLYLAGADDYAWTLEPTLPKAWTIEYWWRPASVTSVLSFVTCATILATNWGIVIATDASNKLKLSLSSGTSSFDIANGVSGNTALSTSTWYHIALVCDGNNYVLYLNGTAEANLCLSGKASTYSSTYMVLGWSSTSATGYYEDFRFSPYARYIGAFTAPTASLVPDEVHYYNVSKGAMYKGNPSAGWTKTARLFVGDCNSTFSTDGLYQGGGLGTLPGTAKNVYTEIRHCVSGTGYFKNRDQSTGLTPTATTVPQNKWGLFGYEIGTDGTIHNKDASANSTGYATEALALAALPSATASHTIFGYFTVMKSDGNFVGGTTVLDSANVTVNYYGPSLTYSLASILSYDLQNGFLMTPQQSSTSGILINGNFEVQI